MGSILLRNITLGDSQKDILIEKGLIRKIEPSGSCADWQLAGDVEIMQCASKVVVPGFVNMHTHAGMTMMKGVGEDAVFKDWIRRIWDIEAKIDADYIYWATKVACIEMIKSGTTAFNDQYWHHAASIRAASEMGIRIATGYDFLDRFDPAETARQTEQCQRQTEAALSDSRNGLAMYQLAFHAVYTVSEPALLWIRDYAEKLGLRIHIHLSETRGEVEDCKAAHGGLSPVEYLDSLGLLSPRILAAHTLWLSERDIEILAKRGVHCIHNINSNTKLASGWRFLYNELRDAGVNVCLGTDGCGSSNNLDMLEAMKTTAIFQKAWRDDPSAMPLDELLDCATVNGARALRFDGGRIAEGAVADLSIIDTDNTAFLSPGPFLANLVYAAHSDCVDSVICNGSFVMRHREIPGEKEILAEARKVMDRILK